MSFDFRLFIDQVIIILKQIGHKHIQFRATGKSIASIARKFQCFYAFTHNYIFEIVHTRTQMINDISKFHFKKPEITQETKRIVIKKNGPNK